MMSWKLCGRKRSWSVLRHYPVSFWEDPKKSQNIPAPASRILNILKIYDERVLTTPQRQFCEKYQIIQLKNSAPFIVSLSTAAVTGCPGGYRLSKR